MSFHLRKRLPQNCQIQPVYRAVPVAVCQRRSVLGQAFYAQKILLEKHQVCGGNAAVSVAVPQKRLVRITLYRQELLHQRVIINNAVVPVLVNV